MKMVLIPESEYRQLKPQEGVKDKVDKILKGKRDDNAAKQMSQIFGRHLRTMKPEKMPKHISKDEIAKKLPVIYHEKVNNFLNQLEQYGSSWTDNFDFVTKGGRIVGNIVDLLKEAFVGSKSIRGNVPQGWEQFLQEIISANIQRNIFGKRSTKNYIDQQKATRRGNTTPTHKEAAANLQWKNF